MANTITNVGDGSQVVQMLFDSTGEQVISVPLNKRVTLLVNNPGGTSTFDIIGYDMTEAEATSASITRTKGIIQSGLTDVDTTEVTPGGFREVGIDVTAFAGGPVKADLLVAGLSPV